MRMDVRIRPHALAGAVTPPPSKSMAHRLLLAAALADGVSTVKNVALSQDIEATLRCMAALGASWERTDKSTLRVTGIGGKRKPFPELPRFDCGESGSTLRFLIPIALAVAGGGVFTGRGRLMERPQKPYFDLFDEKGISYEQTAGALTVRGTLTPGEYRLAGNVSSQFFTGLLFALPLLGGGSTLVSTTRLESRDYVAMTRDALARAGVRVDGEAERFAVPPSVYRSFDAAVEADWSQAGFWYAARFLGNRVELRGLKGNCVITVKDDGCGFGDIDPKLLFDRFYRTDSSRQRGTGGTGLGLAIVKSIVEAHDGTVEAVNLSGGGACFIVAIPAIPAA